MSDDPAVRKLWRQTRTVAGKDSWTRWEEDNRIVPNPWAFVAVAALIGAVVVLAVLIAVL